MQRVGCVHCSAGCLVPCCSPGAPPSPKSQIPFSSGHGNTRTHTADTEHTSRFRGTKPAGHTAKLPRGVRSSAGEWGDRVPTQHADTGDLKWFGVVLITALTLHFRERFSKRRGSRIRKLRSSRCTSSTALLFPRLIDFFHPFEINKSIFSFTAILARVCFLHRSPAT